MFHIIRSSFMRFSSSHHEHAITSDGIPWTTPNTSRARRHDVHFFAIFRLFAFMRSFASPVFIVLAPYFNFFSFFYHRSSIDSRQFRSSHSSINRSPPLDHLHLIYTPFHIVVQRLRTHLPRASAFCVCVVYAKQTTGTPRMKIPRKKPLHLPPPAVSRFHHSSPHASSPVRLKHLDHHLGDLVGAGQHRLLLLRVERCAVKLSELVGMKHQRLGRLPPPLLRRVLFGEHQRVVGGRPGKVNLA